MELNNLTYNFTLFFQICICHHATIKYFILNMHTKIVCLLTQSKTCSNDSWKAFRNGSYSQSNSNLEIIDGSLHKQTQNKLNMSDRRIIPTNLLLKKTKQYEIVAWYPLNAITVDSHLQPFTLDYS